MFLILIFATITGLAAHTLIYCRKAWRLLLEDQGGSSRVRKTTRNYGLRRCCNYDLRRWKAHGGRGASNSEAREKFGAQQIVGAAKEIVAEEVGRFWREYVVGEEGRLC